MNTSRREFIRYTAIAGTSILLRPFSAFGVASEAGKFLERIGISTGIANNGILAAAGYSFVEENVRGFLVPAEPDSVFEQKLALLKVSKLPVEACNSFLPGNLKCVGPSSAHEEILKFGETAFRRAEMAGVKTIVFGSGGARSIPEGFSRDEAKQQFISICKQLTPFAQKYNIVISLEPLNTQECNFINSVAEGGEIVQAVNHENFRLLADIYHMLKENESPLNITRYGHLLYHTHIAEKTGRTAPGVNNEDFTPYFKALKDVKYEGRMAIECSWKNLGEQAANALRVMRNQLAAIN
ncbi:MAG: sugar phosphate isomerase/epimerase [Bacteroidia bacterium]|nr:sugar phosphate isomerase/epimerase [Bacteroidia bacterium]